MKRIRPSSRLSGPAQESETTTRFRGCPEHFSGTSRVHRALRTRLIGLTRLLPRSPEGATPSPDGLFFGEAFPDASPRYSHPLLLRGPMSFFVPAPLFRRSEDTFCHQQRLGGWAPVCALECHHDPEGQPRVPEATPDRNDRQSTPSRLPTVSPSPFLRPDKAMSHIYAPPAPPPLDRSEPIASSSLRHPARRDRFDSDGRPFNAGDPR